MFVDESGFYLLPALARTYAPRGQTPILREQVSRDHLSAISGMTPEGQLYLLMQDRAIKGKDVARFLRHLTRWIAGPLLVIWDGNPPHRSQEVKAFLGSAAGQRVRLERLPAYAPDLNPDEGIWHYLKGVELKNLASQHLEHLAHELRKAVRRLKRKPHVIRGCMGLSALV